MAYLLVIVVYGVDLGADVVTPFLGLYSTYKDNSGKMRDLHMNCTRKRSRYFS
ncbi:MAG TPA: hypothetical protein V6C95_22260 [Coleofasciculaceae cyanobacterium]